jgi:RNA recognition motif-containing protein
VIFLQLFIQIAHHSDGRSRLFGFIGFRTEKEAKAAMNFFNNTFIDTSKISVEMARPVRRDFFAFSLFFCPFFCSRHVHLACAPAGGRHCAAASVE